MWLLIGKVGLEFLALVLCAALLGNVVAAVHHAEVVARRLGEPFGTLVLALAVTVIEVALIISIMLSGEPNLSLLRDSVHAVVMLVLHGLAGLCILVGAFRQRESEFQVEGAKAFLAVLIPMATLVMVLPNYLVSAPGPYYSPLQLAFVSVSCLGLYIAFLFIQTGWHRAYFLPVGEGRRRRARKTEWSDCARFPCHAAGSALVCRAAGEELGASARGGGPGRRRPACNCWYHNRCRCAVAGNGRGNPCGGSPPAAGEH